METVRDRRTAIALAAWAVLVAIGASPLSGQIDPRIGPLVLPAAGLGVVAVAAGPALADRLPWRWLLVATFALAAVWAVALASVDGWHAVSDPLRSRYDYLHDLPLVASPGYFLETFTKRIGTYTTHVRGHPPGMLLLLWFLHRLGLGGAGWATALVIAGGVAAAPAVMVATREVASEAAARRAAPFLALAPAMVWVATSADALFAGVSAWGVALIVLATGKKSTGDALAFAGGLLLGAALFLTYGAVPLGFLALAVAVARRRVRPIAIGGAAILLVVMAFGASGFWWPDGLAATLHQYSRANAGLGRDYLPFLLFNLGVLAIALGPAVAVALARLRDRAVWLLTGPTLLAIALIDLSGLSKGEVERIWLPFLPWIVLATTAFSGSHLERRAWLAAHAGAALAVQIVFRTPW